MESKVENNIDKLVAGLSPLERAVVPHLARHSALLPLSKAANLQEVEAMRALQWLEAKECLKITTEEHDVLLVTAKGKQAAEHGLPEQHALWALQKKKSLAVADIPSILPDYDKSASGAIIGALKRAHVPFGTSKEGKPCFTWVEGIVVPQSPEALALEAAAKNEWIIDLGVVDQKVAAGARELLKRQGYAELRKLREKRYALTPLGASLTKAAAISPQYEERLTPAMLKDGSWKSKRFRPYNVTINVPRDHGGREHFVNEAIAYIKRIWLELGFTEMEGAHVQTAFWDLDALFVPQDHPAREMQDTFYLAEPERGKVPAELFKKVKAVHEHGGSTGSRGWGYKFSEEESKRNLLRTHTTVLSAQTLYAISQGKMKIPGKYFSVSTVYRNEALDWKHLFEFHQVEGIVVDEHANLQHLKGYLREFFGKMGFPDVRIRPGHFPYCEPSGEIDVFDPQRKQWVELGGCGIFRPEVTKSLMDKEVPVLAWGLGMERIIKEYYGLDDIRDLYRNDLKQLKSMKMWMK